jgi:hypothetical protein
VDGVDAAISLTESVYNDVLPLAQMGKKCSTLELQTEDHQLQLERSLDYDSEIFPRLDLNNGVSQKRMSKDVFYLYIGKIEMRKIDSLMPELIEAKAIICDLRGYPKGNHEFISHLLPVADTTSSWMQIPMFIYPDQKDIVGFTKENWMLPTKAPHLEAKILFMTAGSAISYAESYLGYIEGYNLATIVGQPTAGTNGNINAFSLPGGFHITWTGMKVLKQDGSQHHGIGILPHVLVERTINGVREGRDEFLEKAIELAQRN